MATTTEQRAKFKELRLSGVPREQAQTQAYGSIAPIQNAPVAGVAPAVTPTEPTPVNVNEQQRIDNQTKRQEMIANGQVPAVGQNPTTGTGVDGVTVDANGNISNTTGKRQKIKNMSGQEFYVDADQTQMQQSFGTPGYGQGTTTPSGATLNSSGTITQGVTPKKTALEQAIEDSKNGVIRQPEYYNNLTNGTSSPVNEEIKAKNEAQMALNKQQADLRDQERQKIAQETAQANTPKSASEMYNLIASKSPIADELKTTSSYKVAQNRYQRASKYLTMTPTQLSSEIKGAKLIEGSDTWNDLSAMNPKLVQDATNLRNVNGNKTNIWTYVNNPDGTRVKENSLENQFTNDYLDDYGAFLKSVYTPQTQAEVTAAIYTQDVKDAQNKATSYETELNAIEKDMDAIEKDVEKELTGTGATGSRSRLEKMARKEALQTEYNSVLKSYTTYANKANNLITQNTSAYEKAYTQKQALNTALASAGSLKYQNQLTLQNNQAEFDQKIAQQAQAMNDPTTAISTMIEEYKKLGIPFTRSTQQIIQDFESSGQDLGTYLTELQKLVQEKPEYQAMQARKAGEGVSYQTFGDSVYRVNADGSLTKTDISAKSATTADTKPFKVGDDTYQLNPSTGKYEKITGTQSTATPTGTLTPVKLGDKTVTLDSVASSSITTAFDEIKATGQNLIVGEGHRDQVATIKSMADRYGIPFNASNPAETARQLTAAGHTVAAPGLSKHETGMAIDLYSDGMKAPTPEQVKILNSKGWFQTAGANDMGHFEYLGVQGQGTQATGKQYSDSEIELFADIAAQDGSVQNTSLKNSGLTRQQLADYKAAAAAGKIPPTEGQKQAAIGILSNIQGIASTDWTDAVGKYDYSRGMGLQDASDTSVLIENLRDAAAFNNLGMIKGPMSDKDIAFLKSVSSKLDPIQSNKQFEKNIVEMYNIAARKAGIKEITKLSDIPKERITPGQVQPQENTGGGQTFQGYTLKPFN